MSSFLVHSNRTTLQTESTEFLTTRTEKPKDDVIPCIVSKDAYQNLLKQLVKPPTAQKSLEIMLGLEDVDWSRIYLLPRATTIESSLRSFQYKILNNTLYLNARLFKLNAVESLLCSLRICFAFVLHVLSDPQFVGTILFMGIECQHFTYFRLRLTILYIGHV